MNFRFLGTTLGAVALCAMLAGCAAPAGEVPTCDQVCGRLAALCGSRPPGCESQCESLAGADDRRCAVSAATCSAALGCGSVADGGSATPDSSTDGSSRDRDAAPEDAPPHAPIDCTPDSPSSTFGFVGSDTDRCDAPCRVYGGLGGAGRWCTAACESDADCDPTGGRRYVCHRLQRFCTVPCGDEAACGGFRTCDTANGYCVF